MGVEILQGVLILGTLVLLGCMLRNQGEKDGGENECFCRQQVVYVEGGRCLGCGRIRND